MKTVELLSNLRHLDVKLWVEGERLRYSAPPKTLNPELIAQLAAHKTEIINLLSQVRTDPAAAPGGSTVADVGRFSGRQDACHGASKRIYLVDRA